MNRKVARIIYDQTVEPAREQCRAIVEADPKPCSTVIRLAWRRFYTIEEKARASYDATLRALTS